MHIRAKLAALAPSAQKPIPLWFLFPPLFVAIYLSHWSLLRLPYFWDEAGYYIPAALDFFHTGALIPFSTVTNAHPPLPSVLLSAWWHLAGTGIGDTRAFLCMVAAAALLGVFRLARLLVDTPVAALVTALTALYPVWFVQSTLAHADLFAAAFTLWALSFYFERWGNPTSLRLDTFRSLSCISILFSLAALSKETAIVTPVALGVWEMFQSIRRRRQSYTRNADVPNLARIGALFAPILPLSLWFLYHYLHTGFIFGNPEFLRYNATANLSLVRVLISLWHRSVHLAVHMNMFVPTLATAAVLLMPALSMPYIEARSSRALSRPALLAFGVIVSSNALAFSVLGGALLTRYLLPLYPLVLLIFVALWYQRVKAWWWIGALSAAAFFFGLWINPPYPFAPEDNLTYRDMVVLHQQAAQIIENRFPGATVLTAWPGVAELQHPYLGYTRTPIDIVAIDNFSLKQIEKAVSNPTLYDTAFVFSTKWVPPSGQINFARRNKSTDTRLYDFHDDLHPDAIAQLLRGEIVWQAYRHGEWAAILRFPRVAEALLSFPLSAQNSHPLRLPPQHASRANDL